MAFEARDLRGGGLPGGDRAGSDRLWHLAELADRPVFDRHLDTVTTAIADRFTLKAHTNVAGRWRAFNGWIARIQDDTGDAGDGPQFVRVCADMVECLAGQRVATYSPMMRDMSEPMSDVVLRYPNEVTALAAGAALYIVCATALTGADIAEPLAPTVAENAAAALSRNPAAAAERFRELLRLTTPWA